MNNKNSIMLYFGHLLPHVWRKNSFWLGLFTIFLVGAVVRFWHLDQFNQLVFDEVYFPKFAYDYLNQAPFFHSHPPLGKFTQAAGIWIYNHLPWVNDPPIGSVPLEEMNAHSWRWVNASFGSLLIVIVAATVYTLTKNKLFSLFSALFIAIDGSLLVASRYGLSNVQILFFGFLSLYFLAKALTLSRHHRRWLVLCGLGLGCTASVKWNGLGYSLVAWSILIGGAVCLSADRWLETTFLHKRTDSLLGNHAIAEGSAYGAPDQKSSVFQRVRWYEYPLFLMALPAALYSLLWVPDFALNSTHAKHGLLGIHRQIGSYHSNSVGADVHPYCSKWYSWPVIGRPMGYHFEKTRTVSPEGKVTKIYQDVHLLGNPALYWIGLAAITWVLAQWLLGMFVWLRLGVIKEHFLIHSIISLGFLANLLPWMLVSRCTFFYHYQSASVFKFLALAWVTAALINHPKKVIKSMGLAVIGLAVVAFVYFLPLNLGLPIESGEFYDRMWFKSWI